MYQIMSIGYIEGIHLKQVKIVRIISVIVLQWGPFTHPGYTHTYCHPIMFYAGLMMGD